jgi:hypothetical protein
MAHIYKSRVADQSVVVGSGPIVLVGLPTQINMRTPSQVMNFGDSAYFAIVSQTANEWEEGLYTYVGQQTLARTNVMDSSNFPTAGPVNFSQGVKDVFLTQPALTAQEADQGVTNAGIAILNFGAKPGSPVAQVAVTGQGLITATSVVRAEINATATVDHSIDEHWIDPPRVVPGNIIPGTGFTIYGAMRDIALPVAFRAPGVPQSPRPAMPYGQWTVSWFWK